MAIFEQHCKDCERILGGRYEEVNLWIDAMFKTKGPRHRRFRHHWAGVEEAAHIFGAHAAKAAVIHIVRDCGRVPTEATYYAYGNVLGLLVNPEMLMYDGADKTALDKFKTVVEEEWEKYHGTTNG